MTLRHIGQKDWYDGHRTVAPMTGYSPRHDVPAPRYPESPTAWSRPAACACTSPRPATGPLVLLLHGFPESWYSWRHQLTALAAAGFHAVAPDQRGYCADRAAGRRRAASASTRSCT